LRDQWIDATNFADRKRLAAEIQARAFEVVPYVPTGKYATATALRKNISGVIVAPPILMWNVEKT